MANERDYSNYEDLAKNEGYPNVAEMISKIGKHNFKRKLQIQMHSTIKIERKSCRWMVNGKQLKDCSEWEQDFMNKFFQEFKNINT